MRIATFLLPAFVIVTAAIASEPTLTANQLDRVIARNGAARAANSLTEPQFDWALHRAEGGDAAWLRTLAALRADTDGARAEGIDLALSNALRTNPVTVLTLVETHRYPKRIDWLCQDRAIEPSAEAARHFRNNAVRSVEAVRAPALSQVRTACLAALRRKA